MDKKNQEIKALIKIGEGPSTSSSRPNRIKLNLKGNLSLNLKSSTRSESKMKSQKKIQNTPKLNLKCKFCPRICQTHREFTLHLAREHKLEYKKQDPSIQKHECELCDKPVTFKSLAALEQHVMEMHVVEKGFHCKICGKKFTDQQFLSKHLQVHSNSNSNSNNKDFPFNCDCCNMKFKERVNLTKHLELKHRRLFYCNKCKMSFKTEPDFTFHLRSEFASNFDKIKSESKKSCFLNFTECSKTSSNKCSICNLSFENMCALNVHTNINHENLKAINSMAKSGISGTKAKTRTSASITSEKKSDCSKDVVPPIKTKEASSLPAAVQDEEVVVLPLESTKSPILLLFRCELCEMYFTMHSLLEDHVKDHHPPILSKSTTITATAATPTTVGESASARPGVFKKPVVPAVFKSKKMTSSQLSSHEKELIDLRRQRDRNRCFICHLSFTRPHDRRRHEKSAGHAMKLNEVLKNSKSK